MSASASRSQPAAPPARTTTEIMPIPDVDHAYYLGSDDNGQPIGRCRCGAPLPDHPSKDTPVDDRHFIVNGDNERWYTYADIVAANEGDSYDVVQFMRRADIGGTERLGMGGISVTRVR